MKWAGGLARAVGRGAAGALAAWRTRGCPTGAATETAGRLGWPAGKALPGAERGAVAAAVARAALRDPPRDDRSRAGRSPFRPEDGRSEGEDWRGQVPWPRPGRPALAPRARGSV